MDLTSGTGRHVFNACSSSGRSSSASTFCPLQQEIEHVVGSLAELSATALPRRAEHLRLGAAHPSRSPVVGAPVLTVSGIAEDDHLVGAIPVFSVVIVAEFRHQVGVIAGEQEQRSPAR